MRTAFGITLAVLAALTGLFYYIFYTPALVLNAVPGIMDKYLPDTSLQSLQVASQLVEYPNRLKLFGIHGEVQWQDEVYNFDIAQLDVVDFLDTWKTKQQAKFNIKGLTFSKKGLELRNADLNLVIVLAGNSFKSYDGSLSAEEIRVTPYHISGTRVHFQGNKEMVTFNEFLTDAYGGKVKGEITLTSAPQISQVIWMEFSGIKSEQMQTINKKFFSQFICEVNGTLRLNRVNGQIQILVLLADMPKGVVLSSAFAERISSYMTDEEKRDTIRGILEKQHNLKLSKAEFRVLSVNENLAGVTFTLDNKEPELHIHETVNIDIARILQKIAFKP